MMSEKKNKELAPMVVLAQHGNKGAYRDLYIRYYKNIYFICSEMTSDASLSIKLTEEIFRKMFESVDKLEDHMAFEQWFYSLAISICRLNIENEDKTGAVESETMGFVHKAVKCAEERDHFGFEHSVMKVIENIVKTLPQEPKVILLYYYFAGLECERISILEHIEEEEAQKEVDAINEILSKKAEKIKEHGLDISAFIADFTNSLKYIASKTFVPDIVHNKVSEEIGVDVNPFAPSPKEKEEMQNQAKAEIEKKTEEPKNVKKNFFTKGDLILFFAVIAAVLIIVTAVKLHDRSKKNSTDSPVQTITTAAEKKAVLWNGAAASSFDGGDGTKESPYQIATGGQMAYLANLINDGNSYYAGCYYILTADIILNETENYSSWDSVAPARKWTPIGYSRQDGDNSYFTGDFNGNDHKITGMYISGEGDYQGLFGVIKNGAVRNLTMDYAYVSAKNFAGGIAGCYLSDSSSSDGFFYCGFSGRIVASGINAGGVAGCIGADGDSAAVSVEGCYSYGSVSAVSSAGGIVGLNEALSGKSSFVNCLNLASVSVSENNGGGIAGANKAHSGEAVIRCCVNIGTVAGPADSSGGISGLNACDTDIGKSEITLSYWLDSSAKAGTINSDGNTGKAVFQNCSALSSGDMKNKEKLSGLDFDEIWEMGSDGYLYPLIRNNTIVTIPEEDSSEDSSNKL